MTQDELNTALAASPSPDRVTPEYLKSRIHSLRYLGPCDTGGEHPDSGTLTFCIITLDNGFQVTGESACADPANYNEAIGRKIAYDMAERKIWPLLGFALKEAMAARNDAKRPPLVYATRCLYKSHKTVTAAPIRSAEFNEDGSGKVAIHDANGQTLVVDIPAGFVRPGKVPQEGDMLVQYQPDGYLSWCPRAVFEAGYRNA